MNRIANLAGSLIETDIYLQRRQSDFTYLSFVSPLPVMPYSLTRHGELEQFGMTIVEEPDNLAINSLALLFDKNGTMQTLYSSHDPNIRGEELERSDNYDWLVQKGQRDKNAGGSPPHQSGLEWLDLMQAEDVHAILLGFLRGKHDSDRGEFAPVRIDRTPAEDIHTFLLGFLDGEAPAHEVSRVSLFDAYFPQDVQTMIAKAKQRSHIWRTHESHKIGSDYTVRIDASNNKEGDTTATYELEYPTGAPGNTGRSIIATINAAAGPLVHFAAFDRNSLSEDYTPARQPFAGDKGDLNRLHEVAAEILDICKVPPVETFDPADMNDDYDDDSYEPLGLDPEREVSVKQLFHRQPRGRRRKSRPTDQV